MDEYQKPRIEVRWVPLAQRSAQRSTVERGPAAMVGEPVRNRLLESLRGLGFIEAVGATTPKEELSELLKVAAEVEHALLLQYLFAAHSIDPDASAESADAQTKIMFVAIQEMAHLLTIQNLILALDGPNAFHIGRETIRIDNPMNPLPFFLEPVSQISLSQYTLAEMPAVFPPGKEAVARRVETIQQEVLGRTGFTPHRVGALYAKLYWILQPTDAPYGPLELQPDPSIGFHPGWHVAASDFTSIDVIRDHEGKPDEWRADFGPDMRIHSATDAATAIVAVNSVMEQGEGISHAEDSHFYEFLETLDLFVAGQVSVLPIATNPFVGHLPPGVSQGSQLKHDYVRLWANLLNVRYSTLLLDIGHSLSLSSQDLDRAWLVDMTFVNMRRVHDLMRQLTSNFMRGLDPSSAPTFELLREDLPGAPRDRWRRQREFVEREQQISVELFARPEIAVDVVGKILLDDLTAEAAARKAFIDDRLSS